MSLLQGLVVVGIPLTVAYLIGYARSRNLLPPGPVGLPFIGNILQLPSQNPEIRFTEFALKYGDLVYITVFGSSMIIVNTYEAAKELLEKRSSIYSDRPRLELFDMMGWGNATTFVRYGPQFRKHRRFIHQDFNQCSVSAYESMQKKQALLLIRDCLRSPQDFMKHLYMFSTATILKATYGRDVTSSNDQLLVLSERAGTLVSQSGSPGATLVDIFPILRHIPTWAPFAGFKRKALFAREAVESMKDIPYQMVKDGMKDGTAQPCLVSSLLLRQKGWDNGQISPEDEEDIKGVAGTLFAAAADTTRGVLTSFVLAMVLNPAVFQKARDEMDRICGKETLPDLSHRESLPYVECVLKESYRWSCPLPLGLPHRVIKDDVYCGYHIPCGVTIISNIYAMTTSCSDPDKFLPERYLYDETLPDPRELIFGFGRRQCPGKYFADTNIWLALTSMIATLNIEKDVSMIPDVKFENGFSRHPAPFSCRISARCEKLVAMINHITA